MIQNIITLQEFARLFNIKLDNFYNVSITKSSIEIQGRKQDNVDLANDLSRKTNFVFTESTFNKFLNISYHSEFAYNKKYNIVTIILT